MTDFPEPAPSESAAGANSSLASNASAGHQPVLPETVLSLLDPQPGQVIFDATLGRGGHAAVILPLIRGGRLVATDLDADNLHFAQQRLAALAANHEVSLELHHRSFAAFLRERAGGCLDQQTDGLPPRFDGLLADLGFASNQMDDPGRGFSFMNDGPLDMRLDPSTGSPASALVNTLPETELADLIYRYGEERLSRRIARRIVEDREDHPFTTTHQLAELCRRCYPPPARGPGGGGRGKSRGRRGRGGQRGGGERGGDSSGDADLSGLADCGQRRAGRIG